MPELSTPLIALQTVFLACSYMPGVSQPGSGALTLMSLFTFGMNVGIACCKKYLEER